MCMRVYAYIHSVSAYLLHMRVSVRVIYVCACMCACVHMHIPVCVYMYVCMYVRACIYIVCVRMCVRMCVCVCVCVCVCIALPGQLLLSSDPDANATVNISILLAFEFAQSARQSWCLNDVACQNM